METTKADIVRNTLFDSEKFTIHNMLTEQADDAKYVDQTAIAIAATAAAFLDRIVTDKNIKSIAKSSGLTLKPAVRSNAGANGSGALKHRVGALEAENIKLMEAGEAMEVRIIRLEVLADIPAPTPPFPSPPGA